MDDSPTQAGASRRKQADDARKKKKYSSKLEPAELRVKSSSNDDTVKSREEIDPSMVFSWFSNVGLKAKETLQHLLLEDDSDHENLYSSEESLRASDGKLVRSPDTSPMKPASKYAKASSRYIYPNGVGKVRVHLISAQRVEVADSAEGDHHAIISVDEFDHSHTSYALTASDFQYAELRTKTVRSSATPVFDKKWTLGVPTYQACVKLALVDSADNSVIGVAKVPIYSLVMGKHGRPADDKKKKKGRRAQEEIIPMRSPHDPSVITGHFSVDITFVEDVQALFLAKIPKQVKAPDEESLSVERLVKHINRFQALINLVGAIFSEYMDLMNWKDAIFTSTMLLIFVYTTLKVNAEYALCCPVFLALCLFTRAYYRRTSGAYEKDTIGRMKANNDPYRPIATLTLAVLETKYGKDPLEPSDPKSSAISDAAPVSLASLWGLSLASVKPAAMLNHKPFISILYRPMRGDFLKLKKTKNEVIAENRTFLIGSIRGADDSSPAIVTSRHTAHAPSDVRSKDAILHNILTPWPKPTQGDVTHVATTRGLSSESEDDLAFVYPLLQPVWKNVISAHTHDSLGTDLEKLPVPPVDKSVEKPKPIKKNKVYVPWEENESEIILSFHREKPSHGLIESLSSAANDIGQVVIPLKSFLDDSTVASSTMVYFCRPHEDVVEICQWYPVVPPVTEVTCMHSNVYLCPIDVFTSDH